MLRLGITQELCKKEYSSKIQDLIKDDPIKHLDKINEMKAKIDKLKDNKTNNRKKIECASSNSLLEGVYYHNGYPCGVDACLKNDYQPVGIQSCGIQINNAHDSKRYVVASPSRTYYAYCAKATNNRIKRKEEEKNKMKNAAKVILLN